MLSALVMSPSLHVLKTFQQSHSKLTSFELK